MIEYMKPELVSKMDSLAKEILGFVFPSAMVVAANPTASLIDTTFISHSSGKLVYHNNNEKAS
ncbi:multidrug and toxin extrusion 69 [Sesbania bispinosa]|nr:multidrug and toxin extrusion 69 [Sesbania bispinosa]